MAANDDSVVPNNCVELFVKAGENGLNYGACPFCQMIYMILDLKSKGGDLTYEVITINMSRPSQEFKKFANRLPVLRHMDEILSDNNEIVNYLDHTFPTPDLRYDNLKANSVCLDVFGKFSSYIKQVSHSAEPLIKEFDAINDYLENAGTKFLCGEHITNLDCLVLPKLQHIRVAAKAFKDFDIPSDMRGLWSYLRTAYDNDTFRKTCPSDQEIVYHWSQKSETPQLPEEKQRHYSTDGEPRFTFDIPSDVELK